MGVFGMMRQTGKGPYRHQTALWKGALAVALGDLVYKDGSDHYDKSAASYPWDTNLATTQASFKDVFRGVSTVRRTTLQTADGTDATDGPILASGEFTFPCDALGAAAYVAYNSYVTIAKASGNALDPAKVVLTTDITIAIGKLTRDAALGATELTFELLPATGPQGAAPANA
ncbi:MAG TPA: hypothetical protein VGE74_28195 [Gemmata sp.]